MSTSATRRIALDEGKLLRASDFSGRRAFKPRIRADFVEFKHGLFIFRELLTFISGGIGR